ncbi:hypothetical protein IMCC3317_27960 [Kordia antarctica]|uniref:Uncharacterized protein n=1 Tax=Kordia antarctica TaxID=1218801 RepID=A0A7L4ZLP7_9FLAO|nr:hypothetical protein IMCC3317_27960 [Kordia antarctica]
MGTRFKAVLDTIFYRKSLELTFVNFKIKIFFQQRTKNKEQRTKNKEQINTSTSLSVNKFHIFIKMLKEK